MASNKFFPVLVLAVLGGVALAQQDDPSEEGADAAGSDEVNTAPTTVIDELSDAEIEAELARAERVLEDPDEVKEFTEGDPLPADLPLALPSDF